MDFSFQAVKFYTIDGFFEVSKIAKKLNPFTEFHFHEKADRNSSVDFWLVKIKLVFIKQNAVNPSFSRFTKP